jgi:hypothetical protein
MMIPIDIEFGMDWNQPDLLSDFHNLPMLAKNPGHVSSVQYQTPVAWKSHKKMVEGGS